MWQVFTDIATNLGVNFETAVYLIVMLGSLVFLARGFTTFIIISFVVYGGLFMWFYNSGLNYTLPVASFFISLVMMALSLYFMNKTQTTGAGLI